MVKLKHCQQKTGGDGGATGCKSNFVHERFVRYLAAAGACHTSLFLDVAKHFFPLDRVSWVAHHRKHLECGQGIKCPIVLAKVETWHRATPVSKFPAIKS